MEGLSATIDKGKLGVDDGPKEFKEEEFIGLKG